MGGHMNGQRDDYPSRIGMALSAVRDYLALTQQEVADAGNTSMSTISRLEGGLATRVDVLMLRGIAARLDVPLELLTEPPSSRDAVFEALALHRAARRRAADGLA